MKRLLEEAVRHHRQGRLNKAEALYRRILKARPRDPDSLHLLGCIELARNHRERAVSLIRKAIAVAPQVALYHENLAEAYHRDHRPELAESECRLALRLDARRFAAANRLGVLAMEKEDYEEAKNWFSKALDIRPNPESFVNLGALLNRTGEFDLAVQACELALRLAPENPLAWNNLGLARKGLGLREEAMEAFSRAGNLPMAAYNRGYLLLWEGRLAEGLPLLERRRELVPVGTGLRGAEWDGRPHPDRTLLVAQEQGLGDTILVSRFFPALRERFARVVVAAPQPLRRLLAATHPEVTVVEDPAEADYDLWCPTMSVPFRLGLESPEDVPLDPWIRLERRRSPGGPLRAGINWAGNPSFRFDRIRSTHLETLASLLEIPGVEWVSLHKGHREEEADRFGLPQPLRDAGDFLDTAEVIADLDLVVSTETAVPNLSAAMGIPTCVLAAVDHDWRWHGWYRDAVVCAQEKPGDWTGAVEKAGRLVRGAVERREAVVSGS